MFLLTTRSCVSGGWEGRRWGLLMNDLRRLKEEVVWKMAVSSKHSWRGGIISWKAMCADKLCILICLYFFFLPSKMVIEINIIPRATFVYKQCPYCNPARSWKWNEAFNELAALSPWGLPHARTQRRREREDNICNLRIWVRYRGQTALNHLQLLLICLHSHLLILICPSCGNTLPLFSLTGAYDFTAHSSSGPL